MDRARHCVRPGCGAPASATLTYDYARRTVWLDSMDEELEPGAWAMCTAHADALKVPIGWAREDRRTPVIPLRPQIAV